MLPTWNIRLIFHRWVTWKHPLSRWFPACHVFCYTVTRKQNVTTKEEITQSEAKLWKAKSNSNSQSHSNEFHRMLLRGNNWSIQLSVKDTTVTLLDTQIPYKAFYHIIEPQVNHIRSLRETKPHKAFLILGSIHCYRFFPEAVWPQ